MNIIQTVLNFFRPTTTVASAVAGLDKIITDLSEVKARCGDRCDDIISEQETLGIELKANLAEMDNAERITHNINNLLKG